MRTSSILTGLVLVSALAGSAFAGAAGPRPAAPTVPELSNAIDQFKAAAGTARTPAQLDTACAAIVAAALPALESDDAGLHQVGRTLTLDFAFHVTRPGAGADREAFSKALAAKLGAAKPQAKVWMCRLLQHIGRVECVAALAPLLADADAETREAARCALDKNVAAEATAALVAALAKADAPAWRLALVISVGNRADPATVPAVAKGLADKEEGVAMSAAYALGKIGGTEAVKALTAAKASTTGKTQGAVLDGLLLAADRLVRENKLEEAGAIYAGLDAATLPPQVRQAALRGTIITSGEKALPLLTEALTGADTAKRAFALAILPEVRGAAGTKALVALMPKLAPAEQAVLLNELAARNDDAAKPALLEALKSSDDGVRAAAIGAMAVAGDESALPALLERVTKAKADADRTAATRAAAAVCTRSANKEACAAAILKAGSSAQGPARIALISLLPQAPTKAALEVVRGTLKETDADLLTAAIAALSQWPNAGPAQDLLNVTKGDAPLARQLQALRGYLRLASLGDVAAADRTKMYESALAALKRPEDRPMLLSEMAAYPSAQALAVIKPLLTGEAKNEAAAAILKIAAAVAATAPAEAKAALQQVADSGANESFKTQAQKALAALNKAL
jgi:HEAT repeat protein